jgi:uncharacterized protein
MAQGFLKVCAVAAIVAASPALADVKAGVEAWSRGDYQGAVKQWVGPAAAGDADAQFNLAQAFKLGRGVKPDLARAEEWFGRAAGQGHLQAADNLGLLLFQRGEKARAMPFIRAAADRGDPRAQYILGLAHFNGDSVPKDWVRAYALVSLAQQAGLAQAAPALAQMDQYIPLEQRQASVPVASDLAASAEATRARQIAAADLGVTDPGARPRRVASGEQMGVPAVREPVMTPEQAAAAAARAAGSSSPRTAGADYTRPRVPQVAAILEEGSQPRPAPSLPRPVPAITQPRPVTMPPARVATPPPRPAPPAAHAIAASGSWRVQLGAFGVAANADALWNQVRGRPELSGHPRINAAAGKLTKLQAGGFAGQADAQAACARLTAAGFSCIAVRD